MTFTTDIARRYMPNEAPIVFISYSHDSDDHRQRVLELSERLRRDGYQTRLDQYVNGTPEGGWPRWMRNQLQEATFTLMICTETYFKRFWGDEVPERGHGVAFEGTMITNALYVSKCQLLKFVPVLFETNAQKFIPEPLQSATHYLLESENAYQALRKFLDGAAGVEAGSVGKWKPYARATGTPLTFAESPSSKPNNLPFVSLQHLFMGRGEALEDLRQRLTEQPGRAAAVITRQAIHGLGGVGKTRLAIEYAWRHASVYSALLFVTADSPERLQANLAGLAKTLLLSQQPPEDQPAQVSAVLACLAKNPGWLLIVDNVDSPPAAQAVEAILPRLTAGHILITSRLSNWSAAVQVQELGVLDSAAAVEFMLARSTSPSESARAAERLAQDLGCLALALEQAAAYAKRMRLSLAVYHERWKAREATVHEWYDARLMQYPASLATTWQTTLDQLKPEAVGLLHTLAWFAPEPLPISVLSAPAMSPSFHSSSVRELVAELADFSMVSIDPSSDTVKVHRVVQEILRTRQPEPDRVLTSALRLLSTARPDGDPSDVRTWSIWEPLAAHVVCAADHAEQQRIDEPTNELLAALGSFFSAKALHAEAERLRRRALAIDERHYGPNSSQVALRLVELGQTLWATNRLAEAEPLVRRALAINEQLYGPNHPDVARDLNNLAQLLKVTNRLPEAEPMYRRALAIDEQLHGTNHPVVAMRLNNLALLLQATNRMAEAEPMYRRALAIDEQLYGTQHPEVARDLGNLATLLRGTNRNAEAEPLMRRALAINEQSYGPKHPYVARDLNNLARLLQDANEMTEAEPLMRRALAIFELSLGENHPNAASALYNLAQLLQATNRLTEAEPLMRRALEIFLKFTRATGHNNPNLPKVVNTYSQLLVAAGRTPDQIRTELMALGQEHGVQLDL